ncbi:hypothetical protein Sango_2990700 [Sesamum angolense]|uniref:Endonuclease/exonuclease/phosphatase domain-containing protein n=1 Tax=Sesamum angolense TaxID=2727404 RepID=A0AAE1VXD9_9LAMI|nr:hypothetical protein Sango_2990700 [Sesamum angolense]
MLLNWSWFDDYSGLEGRIWLVWNPLEVGVEILRVESQFVHCRAFNKRMHTRCLISVLYRDYDIIPRRTLWGALCNLSAGISDVPWLVLGDFNAVMDDSEVCSRAADTSVSMIEFRTCIRDTSLVQLPFTGCPFTWHNYMAKRLDRMLVNIASKLEQNMLQQRAKIQLLKGGDQCSQIFFWKVAMRRAAKRVFQILNEAGRILTAHDEVVEEFVAYYQRLLGERDGVSSLT